MKSNTNFSICVSNFHNNNKPGKTNIEGPLLMKPSEILKLLVNQFNDASPEDNTDPENVVQSKYCDSDELETMKIPNKDKSLALFHINACSLKKTFNELEHLLSCTNKSFDVIAISETRISVTNNLTMNNFSFEFTPTEFSAGGNLLYVPNHLLYKPHFYLNIYKSNELESTFIEMMNPNKSNIIIGCIYKHTSMDLNDFNTNYLNNLLDKVSKERKSVFLIGEFNVNLLNYNNHNPTNEFLDSLASNSFVPCILQPTQLTSHSKTLIDNIFSNIISPEAISCNLTSTISDHLPQFTIVPNVFSNPPLPQINKANIFERDWSNIDQENFILDYFSTNWDIALKIDKQNVNYSTESFLNKINSLLSNYAPLKKINNYNLKFRLKPWITTGIQKSISVKNKFLTNFIKKKDPAKKAELH